MKALKVGVMSKEKIRARTLGIARGEIIPKHGDPKIWFASMKSLAEVLSDDNRALLHVMADIKPETIAELARATGRKPNNLSRTLKTMANFGIVELKKTDHKVVPRARATQFTVITT
ncbi:MAG: transcriptional regulator [Gammaproteobacteria bacterium]|nr:transcriptional regulator [Gammaproteobacteria bacterium]MBU1832766.1 transcriptional regulator [Gammaproteobacteria bacterium]